MEEGTTTTAVWPSSEETREPVAVLKMDTVEPLQTRRRLRRSRTPERKKRSFRLRVSCCRNAAFGLQVKVGGRKNRNGAKVKVYKGRKEKRGSALTAKPLTRVFGP